MNGKTAKRVRKLQRIYGYTEPMYKTMKKIRSSFNSEQAKNFAIEVDAMIDRRIQKIPPVLASESH